MAYFIANVDVALKESSCVLINKVNIDFGVSVARIVCEVLKYEVKVLKYCQSQEKFIDQIEK